MVNNGYMKLCLNTYNLAGKKTLDEITGLCVQSGIGGIEFSIGYGHNHGVEFDTDTKTLHGMAEKIMSAGLETVSIASYCRFDAENPQELIRNFELAKKGIDCAQNLGSKIFRFVGNDLPSFISRSEFVKRVSEYMSRLADYAGPYGIEVLLNMHGSFSYRHDMGKLIEITNKNNCGLVYNCDDSDIIGGSPEIVLDRIGAYIKHVHLHELISAYPYSELFEGLKRRGYKGWYSIVVDEPSSEPQRFISYYCALARALHKQGD